MNEEKNLEILQKLAKDIAQSKYKWLIVKEINDVLDTYYDKYYFSGILAHHGILKPEYFKILGELENRELLLTLKKYIREIIFSKS